MNANVNQIDLLQDSIAKLITVVKFVSERTLKEISYNRNAIIILEQKIDRLLSVYESEDVDFKIITCQAEFDEFEIKLQENSALFLNFFTRTGRNLGSFMTKEFLATLSLDNLKETLFYTKVFVPLCCKRNQNPDTEMAALTRRAKNLKSKRKQLAKNVK